MNAPPEPSLRERIHAFLDDVDTILVFPTETTARYWIADYAYCSPRHALFLNRILSWDTFRGQFLPKKTQKPANSTIRHLFAALFLESEKSNSLRWFANLSADDSNTRFLPSIVSALPQLVLFSNLRDFERSTYDALPSALRHDIELLDESYRTFLSERELYEPLFEQPSIEQFRHREKVRYLVCFPQLIDNFTQFYQDIGSPTWIATALEAYSTKPVTIVQYPNALMELRSVLRHIRILLEHGVSSDEIAITAADLSSWRPYLQQEAAVREIPLAFVQGLSPLDYPGGALLKKFRDVVLRNFSLDSMKNLLLDVSFPWKSIDMHRALIQRAFQLNIPTGSTSVRNVDVWTKKLSIKTDDAELLEFYRNFKAMLVQLSKSTTIQALRITLNVILDSLLEPVWKQQENSILAFCLDRINDLQNAMAACRIESVSSCFSLYLQLLQKTLYVPQVDDARIPVYPYRLAAGIAPTYHFILGCTHDATSTVSGVPNSFPETLHDVLAKQKQDLSAIILSVFSVSGTNVSVSYSREAFDLSSSLAPSSVIEQGSIQTFNERDFNTLRHKDPLYAEEQLWHDDVGGFDGNLRAFWLQKRWFDSAERTVFTEPSDDFAIRKAPEDVVRHFSSSDNLFHISPTSLDMYSTCPAKWSYRYLFNVDGGDTYRLLPLDPLKIGNLIHDIYQQFFKRAAALGPFRKELADTYADVMNEIFERVFNRYRVSSDSPANAAYEYLYHQYVRQIPAIIEKELNQYPNNIVIGLEFPFRQPYADQGYLLEGRIDKILGLSESESKEIVVIDYKKSYTLRRSQYDVESSGEGRSYQLPMYAKVMEAQGYSAVEAAYYNAQEAKFVCIWKRTEDQRKTELLKDLDSKLKAMTEGLKSSDFIASPSKNHCRNCPYRQLCRRRYAFR